MNLSKEQQKYVILKAVDERVVSAVKLDPETKGTGIVRMKRGAKVSDEVLDRRYQNLVMQIGEEGVEKLMQGYGGDGQELPKASAKPIASQGRPVEPAKPKDKTEGLQGELEAAKARIVKLEGRITELEGENKELHEKLQERSKEPMKIEGWSLVQRKAGGGEHRYWYAGKSKGGKMQWIYLGKELDLKVARAKIEVEEKGQRR